MQGREVNKDGMHSDAVWPELVDVPGRVVDVACGQAHTCFLTGGWEE